MIKRVMIRLCGYSLGGCVLALHLLSGYLLLGLPATLVTAGVQVSAAAWFVRMKIRAPD